MGAIDEDTLLRALGGEARVATASAGGGGRRRRERGQREGRPRLSRRERRAVNELLLAPDGALDAKAELDREAWTPTPFAALLRAPPPPAPPRQQETQQQRQQRQQQAQRRGAGRRVRALARTKGAPVRAVVRSIEERVRAVRPGEVLALRLDGALARLVAHAVAQFYGLGHRSTGDPPHRVVRVSAPPAAAPPPPARLVDILA